MCQSVTKESAAADVAPVEEAEATAGAASVGQLLQFATGIDRVLTIGAVLFAIGAGVAQVGNLPTTINTFSANSPCRRAGFLPPDHE